MPTAELPDPRRRAAPLQATSIAAGDARLPDVVRVALADSSLGLVLVAVGADGVRAVQLGDDPAALHAELRARLPAATLAPADDEARAVAARVVAAIERDARDASGSAADDALPLAARGTDFQRRVWAALREIPRGTTTTYAALAARVGRPAAVRAVAGACAANPLAVLVPCHRVVRADGALSGYRWGVARKRALLARESGG